MFRFFNSRPSITGFPVTVAGASGASAIRLSVAVGAVLRLSPRYTNRMELLAAAEAARGVSAINRTAPSAFAADTIKVARRHWPPDDD